MTEKQYQAFLEQVTSRLTSDLNASGKSWKASDVHNTLRALAHSIQQEQGFFPETMMAAYWPFFLQLLAKKMTLRPGGKPSSGSRVLLK